MSLGWNEIKDRALHFASEWKDAANEEAEAKQFLIEFFNVFGISNRRVATFEHRVKKLDDSDGYIDLLWKGNLLIEMKSRGRNLDKAYEQARDYTFGLSEAELPRYILVSDFANLRLYDLEEDQRYDFPLNDLVNHVQLFGFMAGYQKKVYREEDPVNIQAAYHMGVLHDALRQAGYTGRDLEIYLVRLLFCLFADDTGIFERGIFIDYIQQRTNADGSDLGMHLAQLFQVLNTPPDRRQTTLDESLAQFPYINGHLFESQLPLASFNSSMRATLMQCAVLDWNKISPAIFGSMFQSVMNETERRSLGAHYTSEKNILKLIRPLFLDALWQEFETAKGSSGRLKAFHKKIASLRFLDPACGCGNFLVITYRELRLLELSILKELQKGQMVSDISQLVLCDVDRFYGIEYEEFPAQIAQVALWLTDHQMNMMVSQEFGEYFVRLPLRKSAHITHGNALRTDWDSLVEPLPWETGNRFNYILGNPPFVGSKMMTKEQRFEVTSEFDGYDGSGVMDYVTAWYAKAAKYINRENQLNGYENEIHTRVAFVSTNSIAQGEQVGTLWSYLMNRHGLKINFAHQTFKWRNEARGVAAVYCVIVGFAKIEDAVKRIFVYDDIKGDPHEILTNHINPYLVEGKDIFIRSRSSSICNVPRIRFGNQPIDGGFLLFTENEMNSIIDQEPNSKFLFRRYIGSDEFINNFSRYCLWLKDTDPNDIKRFPFVIERLEKVRQFRLSSSRKETRELAAFPGQFAFVSHTEKEYIIIPSVSSERRQYIPIGFMPPDVVASNLCLIVPDTSMFHFGVLTSIMHMTWVKYVCGRLKSDYRYSNSIVYNNFPWPENPTDKQKETVEQSAQRVLDARAEFAGSSLADLYDPLTMPPALVKAHQSLDKAVDLCYRPQPFATETKRIEYLFELYDKYTAGLFAKKK